MADPRTPVCSGALRSSSYKRECITSKQTGVWCRCLPHLLVKMSAELLHQALPSAHLRHHKKLKPPVQHGPPPIAALLIPPSHKLVLSSPPPKPSHWAFGRKLCSVLKTLLHSFKPFSQLSVCLLALRTLITLHFCELRVGSPP